MLSVPSIPSDAGEQGGKRRSKGEGDERGMREGSRTNPQRCEYFAHITRIFSRFAT
jgi:hypothetical protein